MKNSPGSFLRPVGMGVALGVASCVFAAPSIVPAPREQNWRDAVFSVGAKTVTETLVRFADAKDLPPEGYRLSITAKGIDAEIADASGAAHAMATLRQIASRSGDEKKGYTLAFPQGTVKDWPAYRWRGFMLDEGRHFFGKETVKRILDQMANFKLNVFHWHLTEDQGWRLAIDGMPELVQYGSWRPESLRHGCPGVPGRDRPEWLLTNGEKYGPYFYTAEDVREIVAYATSRHIRVVPEIELPGHVRALLAARPEFSCKGEHQRYPALFNGIQNEVLCAGNDAAIAYFERILDEVCKLFPGEYVHIGGDECPKEAWKKCPKCQARIRALKLKDEDALQAWVTRHFTDYLAKRGRHAIGWDEVFAGEPGKDTIIQGWHIAHGNKFGLKAAEAGYPVIVSDLSRTYFSIAQGCEDDPYTYLSPGGRLTLEKAYGFDPFRDMSEAAKKNVIGAECCMWSECTWNLYDLEFKLFPRICAFAEAVWSAPEAKRDFAGFEKRMAVRRKALIAEGVNCAPLK